MKLSQSIWYIYHACIQCASKSIFIACTYSHIHSSYFYNYRQNEELIQANSEHKQ